MAISCQAGITHGVSYAEQASAFFLSKRALYFYNINEFLGNTKVKEMTCFEGGLVKSIINCFEFRNSRSVGFEVVNCIKVPNMTTGSTEWRSQEQETHLAVRELFAFISLSPFFIDPLAWVAMTAEIKELAAVFATGARRSAAGFGIVIFDLGKLLD